MSLYGPDIVLDQPAYIDPSARLYGKIRIGRGVSIWPNAVIRCENHEIIVGEHSNLQDGVILHIGGRRGGTTVGAHCSITHRAVLHGCTVEDNCLIGIGAVLMDGVVIGRNTVVAGGAFLTEGTVIPPNSVVMGLPGKVVRTKNNFVANRMNAFAYWQNGLAYARGDYRAWAAAERAATMAAERTRLEAMPEARE